MRPSGPAMELMKAAATHCNRPTRADARAAVGGMKLWGRHPGKSSAGGEMVVVQQAVATVVTPANRPGSPQLRTRAGAVAGPSPRP